MERADSEHLVERTLAICRRSKPSALLQKYLKAPEIVATALVAAAAAASSIVTLGSAAAVEALGTFLPLYVLKTHGTQVLTDKRRGRTLVTYFLAVQALHLLESLRRHSVVRTFLRFVDGSNWRNSYFLVKAVILVALIQCDFKARRALGILIKDTPHAFHKAKVKLHQAVAGLDTPVKTEQRRQTLSAREDPTPKY